MGKEASKKLTQAERRSQVAALWRGGFTMREIAATLGVGKSTVNRDIQFLVAEYQEEARKNVTAQIARDLSRIERAAGKMASDALSGDAKAAGALVKLLERKARMLGYDGAIKIDVTGDMGRRDISREEMVEQYADAFSRAADRDAAALN